MKPNVHEHVTRFGAKLCFTVVEAEETGVSKLRCMEINTIQRRFPKEKIEIKTNTDDNFVALIKFMPTDPDWVS